MILNIFLADSSAQTPYHFAQYNLHLYQLQPLILHVTFEDAEYLKYVCHIFCYVIMITTVPFCVLRLSEVLCTY